MGAAEAVAAGTTASRKKQPTARAGRALCRSAGARTTVADLASAIASLTEGVWLNQCLTRTHPSDPSQPIAELLRRSGRLLWAGATVPR